MLYPDTLLISIDLETLSNRAPMAAIATIGMAAIELGAPHTVLASYYARVTRESATLSGIVCEETMQWWAKQPPEARAEIENGDTTLHDALEGLARAINTVSAGREPHAVMVVARAPSFDCAILDQQFRCFGMQTPWKYWQERDHRSLEDALRAALELRRLEHQSYRSSIPVAHHAMLDAVAQAQYLGELYANLRRAQHEKDAA